MIIIPLKHSNGTTQADAKPVFSNGTTAKPIAKVFTGSGTVQNQVYNSKFSVYHKTDGIDYSGAWRALSVSNGNLAEKTVSRAAQDVLEAYNGSAYAKVGILASELFLQGNYNNNVSRVQLDTTAAISIRGKTRMVVNAYFETNNGKRYDDPFVYISAGQAWFDYNNPMPIGTILTSARLSSTTVVLDVSALNGNYHVGVCWQLPSHASQEWHTHKITNIYFE